MLVMAPAHQPERAGGLARPGLLECRLTSNPCVLAIAYGIENTSACCPAVWITAS